MSRRGINIYKRKDGRWEGRYIKARTINNKAIYGYIYGASYKEVKADLIERQNEIKQAASKSNMKDITFHDVKIEWERSNEFKLKDSSKVKYQNLLKNYIMPAIGDKKVSQIDYDCLTNLSNTLLASGGRKKNGLSEKTVSDVVALTKSILNFSSKRGYAVNQSYQSVTVKCTRSTMRVLSIQEQETLNIYLREHLTTSNLGILLSLVTGIRVGELCALRWKNISICDKLIHINSSLQRLQVNNPSASAKTMVIESIPKSDCSLRDIPIPRCILTELKLHQSPSDCYLLTGTQSYTESRTMQYRFKAVLSKCGISNANFHSLRHTFATRCVEAGVDIKTLSELLGHSSVNITLNRYVHPSMSAKRSNMEKLSALFAVK